MGVKSYWFKHDSCAHGDMKIETMLSVYKAEGYGIYWIIIEAMCDEDNHKLNIDTKVVYSVIARRSNVNVDVVESFVDDCVNVFGLFKLKDGFIWSESLLDRLSKRDKIAKARSNAATKRWAKESNPTVKVVKKTTKDDGLFEEFWGSYDKKVGRDKSLSLWGKLSDKEKKSCLSYIPKYKTSQPDKKYRKNPDTFLRNKSWNDELVNSNQQAPEFDNISGNEHKNMFE